MVKFFIENAGCNIDENLNEESKTLNEEPMISSANEANKIIFKPPIVDEKLLFLTPSPIHNQITTELTMTKEPSKEIEEHLTKTVDDNSQNANTIKNN